jgi:hypothetical protein
VSKDNFWPRAWLVYTLGCLALFFYGVFSHELVMSALKPGIVVGGAALGPSGAYPRIMSLFFNIPGTLALVGGSAWSVVVFSRKKAFRYRAWANVLIIIGTLLIAGAGSMARMGRTEGLYAGEMVASAVLLAGFLLAGTLDRGAKTAVEEGRASRANDE